MKGRIEGRNREHKGQEKSVEQRKGNEREMDERRGKV